MIKTIFLDFGNVIARFDHWRAVRRFARHTDMPPEEIYATLYDCKLEDDYERGLLSTRDYIAEGLRRTRIKLSPDEFHRDFIDIFTPNQDVIEAVPRLAATHRIVLASNTNDAHFTHYLQQFAETFAHFAATPTSHQCSHRKPEAGFFEYCQQYAECEPSECLFVDDIETNIAGGRKHGWKVLHYQPGDLLVDRLRELSADG